MKGILILALCLSACAKKDSESNASGPVCSPYASPYEVQYQDGQTRKSEVSLCSDGLYEAKSGDQLIRGNVLVIRLVDLDEQGNRQFYYTALSGQ